MQPVVDRLEDEYGDRVTFVALNAEDEGAAAFDAGGLPGHPSFVIMQPDGSEDWRGFGILSPGDLEEPLQRALNA